MKKINILFLLILSITLQSCLCVKLSPQAINFINLFDTTDTLCLNNNNNNEITLMIPDDMILIYLCPIRNECLKNITNNRKLIYLPISKIDKKNYWLIVYDVTDGYENKTYIASFSKKEYKVTSMLLVKQHMGDFYQINSNINTKKNIIQINYYLKNIENGNKQNIIEEKYSLEPFFRLISTNPQETSVIIQIK